MNYGKSNLSRRKKQISSKKKRKKKRVGVRFFKALIICFLLLIVIGAAGIGIYVKKVIDNTPEVTAKDIMPQGYTTNIVDSNGTLLEQLKDSDSNRVYKKYDEISPTWEKAFVRRGLNVSSSIMVLISRELSVPVSMVLHMASISQKEPAH